MMLELAFWTALIATMPPGYVGVLLLLRFAYWFAVRMRRHA